MEAFYALVQPPSYELMVTPPSSAGSSPRRCVIDDVGTPDASRQPPSPTPSVDSTLKGSPRANDQWEIAPSPLEASRAPADADLPPTPSATEAAAQLQALAADPNPVAEASPDVEPIPCEEPIRRHSHRTMLERDTAWNFKDLKQKTGLEKVWTSGHRFCCLAFSFLICAGTMDAAKQNQNTW